MMKPSPWPLWIAHRGAGKLAPENTLAAFRLGAQHGYAAFECDVKLSSDGVPFLLHDATLDRTSNARGVAGEKPWSELSRVDAGAWHSAAFAGEPLPALATIAEFCRAGGYALNIEIKPTPGTDRHTGEVVAREAERLWAGRATPPLLSSFQADALEGARTGAPQLPRALLIDTFYDGWFDLAQQLGCVVVVANHKLFNAEIVARLHAANLWALCYTVNDESSARALLGMGLDGLITDAVDRFSPHAGRLGV
jgi:glycerophosphoryl diester phosphodiesterase